MELTVAIVVMAITLIAGEIAKITPIPNKYIPLQNIIISVIASVICIVLRVENLGIIETIFTCIIATMSAGGIADLKKIKEN